MGYLVRAYYNISPTKYYKDDLCWSADLKSKTTEDIIIIGSFMEVLVLNHYILVRKIFQSLANDCLGIPKPRISSLTAAKFLFPSIIARHVTLLEVSSAEPSASDVAVRHTCHVSCHVSSHVSKWDPLADVSCHVGGQGSTFIDQSTLTGSGLDRVGVGSPRGTT
ncbi:hypothetical protein Tco_0154863 [Tanacetum coccineum]